MTCDCLNDCGDDPWLKDGSGRATPCDKLAARQEHARVISERLATITALRANYGADNVFELIELMHAEVVRLDAVQRSLFAQRGDLHLAARDPHPPTRHCMCDDCKPSFEECVTDNDHEFWIAVCEGLDAAKPSATHGMNLGQRIAHVGGEVTPSLRVEFGSVMAVKALVEQILRDLPSGKNAAKVVPEDTHLAELGYKHGLHLHTLGSGTQEKAMVKFAREVLELRP